MLWLTVDMVVQLHTDVVLEHGGAAAAVRDLNLLGSAVARPQQMASYAPEGSVSVAHLAAAYAIGIARNHAFIDGNKRAGLVAMGAFLYANGYGFNASQEDALMAMVDLVEKTITEDEFTAWVQSHAFKKE